MGSQHFAYPPRIPAEGSQTSYGASVDALYRRIKHEEGDDTCLSAAARRPFATEARTARIKTTMRATTPALSAAARRPFATEARTARIKMGMRATTPCQAAHWAQSTFQNINLLNQISASISLPEGIVSTCRSGRNLELIVISAGGASHVVLPGNAVDPGSSGRPVTTERDSIIIKKMPNVLVPVIMDFSAIAAPLVTHDFPQFCINRNPRSFFTRRGVKRALLVTSEEKIHAVGMQKFSCDDLIGNSFTNAAADFAAASEQHDELDVLRIDWIRVRVMLVHRRLVAIFNGVQEVSPSWRLRSLPNHLTEPRSRSLSKAWASPHVALLLISAWSLETVEGSPSCY